MVYDFIYCMLHKPVRSPLILGHHLISVLIWPYGVLRHRLVFLILFFVSTEATNVGQHTRILLLKTGCDGTRFYLANGIGWAVAFFVVRMARALTPPSHTAAAPTPSHPAAYRARAAAPLDICDLQARGQLMGRIFAGRTRHFRAFRATPFPIELVLVRDASAPRARRAPFPPRRASLAPRVSTWRPSPAQVLFNHHRHLQVRG